MANNMSSTNQNFVVKHDVRGRKFVIELQNGETALLEYSENPKGVLDLFHTLVPVSHRGQGIGNILAVAAFKHVQDENLKLKLSCTFLQKYLRENPNEVITSRLV